MGIKTRHESFTNTPHHFAGAMKDGPEACPKKRQRAYLNTLALGGAGRHVRIQAPHIFPTVRRLAI
jgi:hypothetical protein